MQVLPIPVATMTTALPELTLLETRVLGVLSEKQRTVPDSYPMSLNALTNGCNQKTARDPVMDASENQVAEAIAHLKTLKLVTEASGGRVTRYGHQLGLVLQVPTQSVALLTVLMLRGPQTAGELRLNCERLHKFSDISAVEAFLQELAERPAGALVAELPRQPGARENRWAHLLSGQPDLEAMALAAAQRSGDVSGLQERVAHLESEVDALRLLVGRLCQELGIQP